jgi:preprotein translocase subunit SecG
MYQVIIVIHVLLGMGVIGLVLMQQGKGADAGAAFGTGSSGTVFGAQGAASFLSRTTAILAGLFFTTSLALAVLNSHKGAVYDLMNTPSAQQESTGGTPGGADKTLDSIPSIPSVSGSPTPNSEQISSPEIKDTVVPKEEKVKIIEENATADHSITTLKGK